jgi:hypothetical protein
MKSVTAKDKRIANEMAGTISRATGSSRDQIISITDLISEGEIEGLVQGEASIYLNDDNVVEPSQSSLNSTYLQNAVLSATNGSNTATVNTTLPIDLLNGSIYRVAYIQGAYTSAVTVGAVATNPRAELTIPAIPLTTASAFFDENEMNWANSVGVSEAATLTINSTGEKIRGRIDISSTTFAHFNPNVVDPNIANRFVAAAQGEAVTISILGRVFINNVSVSGGVSTLTFSGNFPYATGNYSITISAPRTTRGTNWLDSANFSKFSGITGQFRNGTAYQPPITNFGDISGTALTSTTFQSQALEFNDLLSDNPTSPAAQPVVISATSSSATGLGLNAAQTREVDEVRLLFTYASLQNNKAESGDKQGAGVKIKIDLTIYRGLEESTVTLVSSRLHSGNTTSALSFEERINLEPFKPFTDFDITVTRLTRQDGRGVKTTGENTGGKYEITAPGALTSVTSIIKENLSYPYSAYANVTFSSEEFQSVPTRTYHVRGLKVRVPSNYTTREENGTNEATYSGLWNGSLDKIVYTDNPAWIFYDILSNNRYGLGEWISVNDIDKYSLYRIAKYCDELVPDGRGGQEPRFRSNIYLTKSADAYKVLKDMASSFLSMLYWMDGQIVTVIDQAKDPIYTFSKANVIDGAFSYETTGSKTRSNQIIVSWNNPVNNYALEPLIVEDRENIVETGRIITEDASAFGCTSEGQALRYGRWKLWTAVNQTRVVSFKTSINAAFLTPGDVIKIQDADEYNIAYSGRISNSGTLDINTIPLDRTVSLNAGSTYYLSVLLEKATVANEGEEEQTDTKVETIEVTSTGAVSSLELASAFSSVPPRSSVWVLREVTALGTSVASAKDYKILAISEEEKNSFAITAVEHYNEKFDAVDGEFSLVIEEGVEPNYAAIEVPPAPRNLYIEDAPDFNKSGNEFRLTWDAPKNSDGSAYSFISGFEISHNIPGYSNPLNVSAGSFAFLFENVEEDDYFIAVRTINTTGKKSTATTITFSAEDQFEDTIARSSTGIPLGGVSSSILSIDSTGELVFENTPFSFAAPQSKGVFTSYASLSSTVDCYDTDLVLNTAYYVLFDTSASSLLPITFSTFDNIIVWYNPLEASIWTDLGTATIAANSNIVTGSLALQKGDTIKIADDSSSLRYARISSVNLDGTFTIDRSFTTACTAKTLSRAALRIAKENDTIVGKVTRTDVDEATFAPVITVDPSVIPSLRFALFDANFPILDYDGENELVQDLVATPLTLTATAFGFTNPEFRITGAGFAYFDESAETAYTTGTNNVYTKQLTLTSTTYPTDNFAFTVEVREADDPTNTEKQYSTSFVVATIVQGASGRTVKLSPNNGQVVRYEASGTKIPVSLTFTALPDNFTGTITYKFYVGGILQTTGVVGDTFTLQDGDEPAADASILIKVEALEDGLVKAVDFVTAYGLQEGAVGVSAVSGFLTNESHSEPADENGGLLGNLSDAAGTFKVFVGTTDVTGNAAVSYSVVSETGIDATILANGTYSFTGFNGAETSGSVLFRAVVNSSLIPNSSTNVTIDKSFSISKSIKGADSTVPGPDGAPAVQVSATNTNHTFIAGSSGVVSNNNFSTTFIVSKEGVAYTYASSGTTANTYGLTISNEVNCDASDTSGTITITGASDIIDTQAVTSASFKVTVFDRGDSNNTVAVYDITLTKIAQAFRDGGVFTFTGYNSTYASAWAGSLTIAAAQAVAASVISESSDGFITPNDRITVTDGTNAATRIYTGSRTNISSTVTTGSFSAPIVEIFNGSVIVDGTLSADKLTANATFTNNLNVSSRMTLGASGGTGIINSPNKTTYADTDAGIYMDTSSNFYLGNATNYLKFDTTNGLQVKGSFTISSGDITSGLGYTPYNSTNPSGFVNTAQASAAAPIQSVSGTGLSTVSGNVTFNENLLSFSSSQVINWLQYTPYNSTNPSGFVNTAQAAAAAPIQSISGDGISVVNRAASFDSSGLTFTTSQITGFSSAASAAAPVQSVAGLTGAISVASLGSQGLFLASSAGDLAYVDSIAANSSFITGLLNSAYNSSSFNSSASAAAPVQSVAGLTGSISVASLGSQGLFLASTAGPLATFGGSVATTAITSGKMVLSSGSLGFTTGTPTKNNTIVMDTTSGNNAIEIYDGTTLRVKIGKLS